MLADPDMAWTFQVGVESPDDLSEREQARFFFICFSFMRMFEDIHFQFENGSLDSELWEGYKTHYGTYVQSPGLQRYWVARRRIFRQEFVEFIESLALPHVDRLDALVERADEEGSTDHGEQALE